MGRFAPTPSGELHLGSLYTAVGSYLDARAHGGRWLVRMEDLDRAREAPGCAERILRTLEAFGLEWDGEVLRQSLRTERYASALDDLRRRGLTFECSCTRAQLEDEPRYPGTCRSGPQGPASATATRLRVAPERIELVDRVQGFLSQEVAAVAGDPILRRRDRVLAYLLAVVVDDAEQSVTDVVRGADLLGDTPRQILLHRLLGHAPPRYAHLPVLTEPDGAKLAKSRRSVPVAARSAPAVLLDVLTLLGLAAPPGLSGAKPAEALAWATAAWSMDKVPKRINLRVNA